MTRRTGKSACSSGGLRKLACSSICDSAWSTAMAAGLPLFTTNPDDFAGLGGLLAVIPVTRPQVPKER